MATKKKGYAEKMNDLEQLVERLEGGEDDLDKVLADVEEGLKLAQELQAHLEGAEAKVTQLRKKYKGVLADD